jgi:cell division protein FtsQ
LQSLETGPEIWRRANPSPAPRPVLKSAAIILPASRARRRTFASLALALPGVAVALFLCVALSGMMRSASPALAAKIERAFELAGFDLRQVSVTGYRFTADGDIFDAMQLEHARTVLFFDSGAAQRRIEELPWVDTASIARILPDRIEVSITERTPIAVWQRGERCFLVDAKGRVLAPVPRGATPQLPRVAGEGAAAAAAELLVLIAAHPALLHELTLAERVGERRWTLWLADGGSILLPADGAAAALARAQAIASQLAGRPISIDVRVADRALLSEVPRAAAAAGGPPQPIARVRQAQG